MRRALFAAFALLLGAGGWMVGYHYLAREFTVSGTITIASHLQRKVPQGQAILFIIAKNEGGVPVALQRIVNPQFPVSFTLRREDLIVPGARQRDAMLLQVQMNGHGRAGQALPGDLEGDSKGPVQPGDKGIHIVIDHEL